MSSDQWHSLDEQEVLATLHAERSGLSDEEASRRLEIYGPNEVREEKRISPYKIFLDQFKEYLIIILIVASIVSFITGEVLEASTILAIVVLSAALGFTQEYRAEKALEALRRMAAATATVLREGHEKRIVSTEIVPGDILLLASGDMVAADSRLLEAYNLKVNEATLTGESTSVGKSAGILSPETSLVDRKNMVFAGTSITYGRGVAVVVSTGMKTEFGKIAEMLQTVEEIKTPLEDRMKHLGRWLGAIMLIVVAVISGLGLLRGMELLQMFLWGVSLAVAAVPEALPAVVTGSLALGVRRMARRNAIVRRLPAVETLGSTTVICTDKTGTLTRGEMTVTKVFCGDRFVEVGGVGYEPRGELRGDLEGIEEALDWLLKVSVLCNDSALISEDEGWRIIGDPTEGALVVLASKARLSVDDVRRSYPRIGEVPFSSERKRMSTIHKTPDQKIILCMKGAAETVLSRCSYIYLHDKIVSLDEDQRKAILKVNEGMAEGALRVLALAFRELKETSEVYDEGVEADLTFLGLVGMIDPPRPEAKEAVRLCMKAGIRVVMITGDHRLTAKAVAEELQILESGPILTESELTKMSDEEFDRIVEEVYVYARVSPEHKLRIVKALKKKGHVVAMTGDGVNDAPALKNSDIGVAMGVTGTEVTKEASDMVLADDNFATLVDAVKEGRAIYDNIKKYLSYLLSSNVGEILIMFFAGIFGLPLPLTAIQILWVNLVTDGLPAVALGVDPPGPDLMARPPRPPKETIFTKGVLANIILVSALMAGWTLPIFYLFNPTMTVGREYIIAQTMIFTLIVMFEMFNALNCRSERYSVHRVGWLKNRYLIIAIASSILLQLLVIYLPVLQDPFNTIGLNLIQWIMIIGISSTALLGMEIVKRLLFRPR